MHPVAAAACLLAIGLAAACPAAEAAAGDPLARLPALPQPAPAAAAAPQIPELFPGVHCAPGGSASEGVVALPGLLMVDRGPTDGLEVVACLDGGKTHEALMRTRVGNGQLVKAACIAALGFEGEGVGSDEQSGLPARGWPVRVELLWQDDAGAWRSIDASSLVRDRVVDRAYPALPFIYTGSRMLDVRGADGQIARRAFALDSTRSIVVAYDEPDALIASPFPGADADQRFEANSRICPPAGTEVWLRLRRAELPLTLVADAQGELREDDAALAAKLAAAYGPQSAPELRAVAVAVPRGAPRGADVATRRRILAAAAAAGAWVVPVFVIAP